ncbi:hypothetical protein ACFYTQ_23585 [Nocardia sp. NPDC004068]|uniref:hypothetical protein n=1 Tax=Nocardia sp. NPDC004068 TaxID=3364303 RepID=UPI0036820F04
MRVSLVLVVLYLVLHWLLGVLSERHGFGSVDGVGAAFSVVTVLVVGLRVTVLVVMPGLLAYRLAMRLLRRGADTET